MSLLLIWSAALLAPAGDADARVVPDRPTLAAQAPPPAEDPWRIDLALYFWMADLEGDFTVRGVTAEADADFGDLFDHLKMAANLHVELWNKNKFGVISDMHWMDFEDEGAFGAVETTVSLTLGMAEAVAAYRVDEDGMFIDILAGVRWIVLDLDAEIDGAARESESHSYVDPILGLRFGVEAADWLLLTMRVDTGGFGIGTDGEAFVTTLAIFRISEGFAAILGYRAFAMEVEDDDSQVDLRMKGPLVAIDVGF
jgi:hypothetical protein